MARRISLLGLLGALLALAVCAATAHMIELQPSAKECFFEDLNPGDQVRVGCTCEARQSGACMCTS
jgi:hypothetical protein